MDIFCQKYFQEMKIVSVQIQKKNLQKSFFKSWDFYSFYSYTNIGPFFGMRAVRCKRRKRRKLGPVIRLQDWIKLQVSFGVRDFQNLGKTKDGNVCVHECVCVGLFFKCCACDRLRQRRGDWRVFAGPPTCGSCALASVLVTLMSLSRRWRWADKRQTFTTLPLNHSDAEQRAAFIPCKNCRLRRRMHPLRRARAFPRIWHLNFLSRYALVRALEGTERLLSWIFQNFNKPELKLDRFHMQMLRYSHGAKRLRWCIIFTVTWIISKHLRSLWLSNDCLSRSLLWHVFLMKCPKFTWNARHRVLGFVFHRPSMQIGWQ